MNCSAERGRDQCAEFIMSLYLELLCSKRWSPKCRVYNEFIFRTALQKEVETKVQSLDDIVKNTPLVLKFVVSYNRLEKVTNGIFLL